MTSAASCGTFASACGCKGRSRRAREAATATGSKSQRYQCAPVGLAFIDRELRFAAVNGPVGQYRWAINRRDVGPAVAEVLPENGAESEPLCRRVLETEEPMAGAEVVSRASKVARRAIG